MINEIMTPKEGFRVYDLDRLWWKIQELPPSVFRMAAFDFLIACAERLLPLAEGPEDEGGVTNKAIQAAKAWLADPTDENAGKAGAASKAAKDKACPLIGDVRNERQRKAVYAATLVADAARMYGIYAIDAPFICWEAAHATQDPHKEYRWQHSFLKEILRKIEVSK